MYKMREMSVDIQEYAKEYPGTTQRYINWRLQQQLFFSAYPNGSIIVKPPTPDPMSTADTWVSTCSVYTDKKDERPAICSTARKSPSSEDVITDGEYIDPYKLCQIAAIGDALSALGFTAPILSNAEEEQYMQNSIAGDPMGTEPAQTEAQAPQEAKAEAKEEAPKPKRTRKKAGAKPKEESNPENEAVSEAPKVQEQEQNEETKKKKTSEKSETKTEEPSPVKEEPAENKAEEKAEAVAEAPTTEETAETGIASEEEARAIPCTYRNFNKFTIGEIVDMAPENKGCNSFIKWCLDSATAKRKCPQEVAAVEWLKENGKISI